MNKNRYCLQCGIPLADNLGQCPECGLRYIDLGQIQSNDRDLLVLTYQIGDHSIVESLVKITNFERISETYSPLSYGGIYLPTNSISKKVSIEFLEQSSIIHAVSNETEET